MPPYTYIHVNLWHQILNYSYLFINSSINTDFLSSYKDLPIYKIQFFMVPNLYLNILNDIYVNSLRLMYSDLVLQVYYIQILISLTNHYLVIHNVQCRHKHIHAFRYPILVIGLFKIEQVGRSILIGIFWLSCQQNAFRLALAEVITKDPC